MFNKGFIFLHRNLLDWEWYSDHNTTRVFVHLLLTANHKDNKWRGISVKRGETITSLARLSSDIGLSVQCIRTCINRLKSTGELTCKSTKLYSHYTLCNYDKWQSKEYANTQFNTQFNKRSTNDQQTSNKHLTTNNNDNNDNNDNNEITHIEFDSLWNNYPRKIGKKDAFSKYKALYKEDKEIASKIEIAINNYNKECKDKNTEERFIMHGKTFFNGIWEDYLETKKDKVSDIIRIGRLEQIERGIINE